MIFLSWHGSGQRDGSSVQRDDEEDDVAAPVQGDLGHLVLDIEEDDVTAPVQGDLGHLVIEIEEVEEDDMEAGALGAGSAQIDSISFNSIIAFDALLSVYTKLHLPFSKIYDEMALPNGVLRLQPKGGQGYQTGIKECNGNLDGCRNFPRLSIGALSGLLILVRHWSSTRKHGFPSQKFSTSDGNKLMKHSSKGVKTLVLSEGISRFNLSGFSEGISRFNLVQKYKFHKF
ncbi:hypothetical protein Bca52824_061696 [Brassica carinata]|uniref:Uncharacterized protein n=1 Tax=Brassica carinata TaxID=52824 RepID=A0A8X7UKD5_BRACI|nr:hypothetical protein Bca52824_061696 [Brassica carinata]